MIRLVGLDRQRVRSLAFSHIRIVSMRALRWLGLGRPPVGMELHRRRPIVLGRQSRLRIPSFWVGGRASPAVPVDSGEAGCWRLRLTHV